MPLVIPEYITIKTAAGATAAHLSPEADGLKDCWIDKELNGRCTLTFQLPLTSLKWQYLSDLYRIYAGGKEFVVFNPDAIEKTRDGRKVWGKVTAYESWVLLGKSYATVSNDPQTPSPPALAVIILSGGSDLDPSDGYAPGSAGHALKAVLQGSGWTVGTVDVTGTHDLETEKISRLVNVNRIQKTWGGYLIWDSVNKIVHLRNETTWAIYTGYQIRYAKNLKGITRTDDYDIITKLYPFGENDLNIGSVNGGQIYLENHSYTTEGLEGIWVNQDISDPQKLKDEGTKYLEKVCKPRHNYKVKHTDLRALPGYQHEDYDIGHLADLIDEELGFNARARIIRYKFNVFQPWQCEHEVGDPIEKIESMLADSQAMVQYLNTIKTSSGQITAYKLVDESLIKEKIANAAVDATKLDTKTVILLGDTWTDNNPSTGYVSWNQHKLYYAGVEHVITAGNTSQKYIYWDGVSNTYSASAAEPSLTDVQFFIAVNNAGLHDLVWNAPAARKFIGSAFIADLAVKTANIDDLAVTDAKIASLTANKITTGQLLAYLIEIMGKNGYFRINGDEFLVYDKSGALMGRFGHYETLADQTAAFTRASTAYLSDGSSVASGVPRYEYTRQPAPVWQDLFDSDQLAAKYTSGGDTAAAWAISGGVLTATGGTQATLTKNDLLLQDVEIKVNCDQAENGGIIARYQDNKNYYLLALYDDSGSTPSTNLNLYKRVAGSFTSLGSANLTWTRGTSKLIKFTLSGSLLEAYFDGIKVISVTDTAFSGGAVGLRHHGSVAADRYLDFNVYQVQRGVMVEEGTTNLLTANQASVETDTTGFGATSGATLTRTTTQKWSGSACLQVSTPGSVVGEGFYVGLSSALANTAYTGSLWLKGSGTIKVELRDDTNSVYGTATTVTLTGAWQRISHKLTTGATAPGANGLKLVVWTRSAQAVTFYADGLQIEQKAYATSWQLPGATRTVEVLTAPTANVLNVSEGEISLDVYIDPNGVHSASNPTFNMPFAVVTIQASPYQEQNQISFRRNPSSQTWYVYFSNSSGAVANISLGNITIPGVYRITTSWKSGVGGYAYLNGTLKGSVPAANLPTAFNSTMVIGAWTSAGDLSVNSPIKDFRVLNRMRADSEVLTEFNTGLPLEVDEYTTYLMSMDGHLKPTVRDFGLFAQNGRIILQDPSKGQGIELWEGGTQKVLIGRLNDGTIGQIIRGGKLYSSLIRSGAEGDTSYIELAPGFQPLLVKENGKYALTIWTVGGGGAVQFYDTNLNDMRGQILPYNDAYGQGLRIEGRNNVGSSSGVNINGSDVRITSTGDIILDPAASPYNTTVWGDFHTTGTLTAGTKLCTEKTSKGVVGLFTRESPEQRYIDEGRAELVNGECRVDLELNLIESIMPESDDTPWYIHLTPRGPFTLYEAEIGDSYFIIKSHEPGISGKFTWKISATRKDKSGVRFPRMEWLVGGDEENDEVLLPGWEDELLSGVE